MYRLDLFLIGMYNRKDEEFHDAFMSLSEYEKVQVAENILVTMFGGNIPSIGKKDVFSAFARLCPKRLKEICPYLWVAFYNIDIFNLNGKIDGELLDRLISVIQKKSEMGL